MLKISEHDSDDGCIVGKDPKEVTVEEWSEYEHSFNTGLKLVREKCYDCSGESWTEVKKCVCTNCALWPVRMGNVPSNFRKAKEIAHLQLFKKDNFYNLHLTLLIISIFMISK